jgi:Membrane-associated phospholipid phosphatase
MKNKNLVFSVVFFTAFLIFTFFAVFLSSFEYIDKAAETFAVSLRNNELNYFFGSITNFGNFLVLFIISAVLASIPKIRFKIGFPCLAAILISGLFNILLKLIFKRQRPSGENLIVESGYSYPSGHSMMITAVCVMLIIVLYKYFLNNKSRIIPITISSVFLSLLVVTIGFSRIYLGVHYFTDILGGFLISMSIIFLIFYIEPFLLKKLRKKKIDI